MADIHNICSDPTLPDEITPMLYLKGSTPDISAFLQFTFWQPVLFLDHEALWPATSERSGRWLGVAHNIGDALTFWIMDDQSKQVFARSVVRPLQGNLRVKWDPTFASVPIKHTAQNGGDQMPSKSLREDLLASAMDKYDHMEPDPVATQVLPSSTKTPIPQKSSLKPSYINKGLDTTQLLVPITQLEHSSKLVLDNDSVELDESIPTYNRTGQKAYKEVQYNQEYSPSDFQSPENNQKQVTFADNTDVIPDKTQDHSEVNKKKEPRRSERL